MDVEVHNHPDPQDASRPARLRWDPEVSDTLKRVIEEFCTLVRNGVVGPDINLETLRSRGGVFQKLATRFRHVNRSPWMESIFPATPQDPTGFSAFVDLVRARVAASTINVENVKRSNIRHTNSERSAIIVLQEKVAEEKLTETEAMAILEELEIRLSKHHKLHLFDPPKQRQPKHTTVEQGRRERVFRRATRVKQELGVDLSNVACSKGMLFEGLATCFLLHHFGSERVQAQCHLPVAYTDLNGSPHVSVILDGLVDDRAIYEFKWHNSLENITESILPQLQALLDNILRTGGSPHTFPKARVVYNEKCLAMELAMRENIWVLEQAHQMGLPGLARPIGDLLEYVPFEQLIADTAEAQLFQGGLTLIRQVAQEDSVQRMQPIQRCFQRLVRNTEVTERKLSLLFEAIARGKEQGVTLSAFGPPRPMTRRQQIDHEVLAATISKSHSHAKERMLLALYEQSTGEHATKLTDQMVQHLEALPDDTFGDACLVYYAQREHQAHQRMLRGKERREKQDLPANLLKSYELVYRQKVLGDLFHTQRFFDQLEERYYRPFEVLHKKAAKFVRLLGKTPSSVGEVLRGGEVLCDWLEDNTPSGGASSDPEQMLQTFQAFHTADRHMRESLQALIPKLCHFDTSKASSSEVDAVCEQALADVDLVKERLSKMQGILGKLEIWRAVNAAGKRLLGSSEKTSRRRQVRKSGHRRKGRIMVPARPSTEQHAARCGLSLSLVEYEYALDAIALAVNIAADAMDWHRPLATQFLGHLATNLAQGEEVKIAKNLNQVNWGRYACQCFRTFTALCQLYRTGTLAVFEQRGMWLSELRGHAQPELKTKYVQTAADLVAAEMLQDSVSPLHSKSRRLLQQNLQKGYSDLDRFCQDVQSSWDHPDILEILEDRLLFGTVSLMHAHGQLLCRETGMKDSRKSHEEVVRLVRHDSESVFAHLSKGNALGLHYAYDLLARKLFQAKVLAYTDQNAAQDFLINNHPLNQGRMSTFDGARAYVKELANRSEQEFDRLLVHNLT